jgi:hypothetical protein
VKPNNLKIKKGRYGVFKRTKLFPWLVSILVVLGLALIFYFIDSPDINKTNNPQTSTLLLGGADGKFKN